LKYVLELLHEDVVVSMQQVSSSETAPTSVMVLLDQLPSYTRAPRTLGQRSLVCGDEKQGGKSSPAAGRGHSRGPQWPAEEWADDAET
jgi:hypothetical protein